MRAPILPLFPSFCPHRKARVTATIGTLVCRPLPRWAELLEAGPGVVGQAGLGPLIPPSYPFSLLRLFQPHTPFPGLAERSWNSLPWGGSGERVRLVNSVGVTRDRGCPGNRGPRKPCMEGTGGGLPDSHSQLPHLPWMPARTSALILAAVLTVETVAMFSGLTMCLDLCLHLTSATLDLYKQGGKVRSHFQRNEDTRHTANKYQR